MSKVVSFDKALFDDYVRLRGEWTALLGDTEQPLRSEWKDALYERLTRAWNRLPQAGKRFAAFHCRMVYGR